MWLWVHCGMVCLVTTIWHLWSQFANLLTPWFFHQRTQSLTLIFFLWRLSVLHYWVTRPCQWVGGFESCKAVVEERMEKKKKRPRAVCTESSVIARHSSVFLQRGLWFMEESPCCKNLSRITRICRKTGGESSLLCPWCFSYTPILALLISISVYSFDGL